MGGQREVWRLSERPLATRSHSTLAGVLEEYGKVPLSHGAANGFLTRLQASTLRVRDDFRQALIEHVQLAAG
jgi:hypothetical protein